MEIGVRVKRPFGFNFYGKTMRKWELADGQARLSEASPGKDWHQVSLSAWDYSGFEVVEFLPLDNLTNFPKGATLK